MFETFSEFLRTFERGGIVTISPDIPSSSIFADVSSEGDDRHSAGEGKGKPLESLR
jgi:hypothetical protein